MAVLAATIAFASGATAASNTVRLDPATTQVENGATFSVKVIATPTVAISGVSASIVFNKAILQVTTVTRGSAFASAPLFLAGDAAAIAGANKTGKLQNVAAAFFPPASVPAGTQEYLTVGFKAIACGTVNMTMPTGRVDSTMLDGRTASYGVNLQLTTTGAKVTVCAAGAGAVASAGAPEAPGASESTGPSDSFDPNANASAEPGPSESPVPGAVGAVSTPPTNENGSGGSTSDQSGWLTFAVAALAVAAAGLAALIIVLTVIAIAAAIVGTIVVIRIWRRYAEKEAREASEAITPSVAATTSPNPATDVVTADLQPPLEAPTGAAIPLTSAQA